MPAQQNNISGLYFQKSTFADHIEKIVKQIESESGFTVERLVQKSAWWSSTTVGAFHYRGTFQNQPAILKIQGVRPTVSEVTNIQEFTAQNKSTLLRPPKVYWSAPWSEEHQYEALILENLEGAKLVGLPTTWEEIQKFFSVYQNYRHYSLNRPWLDKPTISLSDGIQQSFTEWQKIAAELSPDHPLRQPDDKLLIQQAVDTLIREYVSVDWQFQHGHFSARDIFPKNEQYVILSNLYWSWRLPYYDAVFGFHWYQFDLAAKEGTTIEQLDQHRQWWEEAIQTNIRPSTDQEKRLLELAFLERATAGLNLDGILEPSKVTAWLLNTLRQEIQTFLL